MSKKNSALIGIGHWGSVYLKYIKTLNIINLKKIFYKKNLPNFKALKINKSIFTNKMTNILNDSSIKFVNIVTPVQTHADLTIKFLKKNKFVLVEKPLLMNKNNENKINNLIKKNKRKLTVSYPYLFSKSINYVKKIINKHGLGSLNYIEIYLQQCGRFMKYDVNHLLAPHAISIISIFFKIESIKFNLKKIINHNGHCETSLITCRLKNKTVATINLSLNYANKTNKKIINFYCKKGTVICDLNNKKNSLVAYKYYKIKRKDHKIDQVKKYFIKSYDEKNNMLYVLKKFYYGKYNR